MAKERDSSHLEKRLLSSDWSSTASSLTCPPLQEPLVGKFVSDMKEKTNADGSGLLAVESDTGIGLLSAGTYSGLSYSKMPSALSYSNL
jgi:hypothetical protein